MQVLTGFNEFIALALFIPLPFAAFLLLINVLVRAFVRRRYL